MTPERLIALKVINKEYVNSLGNRVQYGTWYNPGRERYSFDFDDSFTGWKQYDTDQDASYFGVWTRNSTLEIFTFAEGDVTLITCPDAEHYNREIAGMNECYTPGAAFTTYDTETGQVVKYYEDKQGHLA